MLGTSCYPAEALWSFSDGLAAAIGGECVVIETAFTPFEQKRHVGPALLSSAQDYQL